MAACRREASAAATRAVVRTLGSDEQVETAADSSWSSERNGAHFWWWCFPCVSRVRADGLGGCIVLVVTRYSLAATRLFHRIIVISGHLIGMSRGTSTSSDLPTCALFRALFSARGPIMNEDAGLCSFDRSACGFRAGLERVEPNRSFNKYSFRSTDRPILSQ